MSGDAYSAADFKAARDDEVLLARQTVPRWVAPHFVWAVLDELAVKLCAGEATCDAVANGGLRVTTTLDADVQKIAEKWVKVATIVPHTKDPAAAAKRLGLTYEPWMRNLEDKKLRNGALVAQDYQTGEIIAYVGSADYYARTGRPEFQPQYDVAGKGYRQPGSAFKPFNYAIGIDDQAITAGSMIMDSVTDFGGGFTPNNADRLERGPSASALAHRPARVSSKATAFARRCTVCQPKPGGPATAYRPAVSERVYREMTWRAGVVLAGGGSVVADAVFDNRSNRDLIEKAACDFGVSFTGVWLAADPDLLRRRVSDRTEGPSDATVDVLSRQLQRSIGEVDWTHIYADRPPEDIARKHSCSAKEVDRRHQPLPGGGLKIRTGGAAALV